MIDFGLLVLAAFALMLCLLLMLYVVMPAPRNGNTAPPQLGVEAYTGGGCVGKVLLGAVIIVAAGVWWAIGQVH